MLEVEWNRGFYRVGGTVIHGGASLKITSLRIERQQVGPGYFGNRSYLVVKTKEGRTLEIPDDSYRH